MATQEKAVQDTNAHTDADVNPAGENNTSKLATEGSTSNSSQSQANIVDEKKEATTAQKEVEKVSDDKAQHAAAAVDSHTQAEGHQQPAAQQPQGEVKAVQEQGVTSLPDQQAVQEVQQAQKVVQEEQYVIPKIPEGPFVLLPHLTPQWKQYVDILTKTETVENGQALCNLISKLYGHGGFYVFSKMFHDQNNNTLRLTGCEIPLDDVFQTVKSLALDLPKLFPEESLSNFAPLLNNQNRSIVLTRHQVASILACSFLGMISSDNYPQGFQWPHCDITQLYNVGGYGAMFYFVVCIVYYFYRIKTNGIPKGKIHITRKSLEKNINDNLKNSKKPICKVEVTQVYIEKHFTKRFHADFANKYIGGGVLTGGAVQEEILFVIKPECLISLFFCTMMHNHEAIIISGAEQFSAYKGYSGSFNFAGPFEDPTPYNAAMDCLDNHIVGIDATVAYGTNDFAPGMILRDIVKAYAGIYEYDKFPKRVKSSSSNSSNTSEVKEGQEAKPEQQQEEEDTNWFVTGNWGCGAFGGDLELKAVQQLIAASEAGIGVIYSTFGKQPFTDRLTKFVGLFCQNPYLYTSDLTNLLFEYAQTVTQSYHRPSVLTFMEEKLGLLIEQRQPQPPTTPEQQPQHPDQKMDIDTTTTTSTATTTTTTTTPTTSTSSTTTSGAPLPPAGTPEAPAGTPEPSAGNPPAGTPEPSASNPPAGTSEPMNIDKEKESVPQQQQQQHQDTHTTPDQTKTN